jgi:hypothetical protein
MYKIKKVKCLEKIDKSYNDQGFETQYQIWVEGALA